MRSLPLALDTALAREEDHAEAARVAAVAGEHLLAIRREALAQAVGGWRLGDIGDLDANRVILQELRATRPGDAILSEEALDTLARLDADRVWIVDPVDGTREYGEHGRVDWAVHIALVVGGVLAAGAVALPARGLVLHTGEGGVPDVGERPVRPRMVVSRTRPPLITGAIRDAIDGVPVPLGSAGAKAMAVVLGEAEVYAHAGGQYEWDNAAPAAVAARAGLWVSRLDGRPLVYNNADPWLPDLLICTPELAGPILDAVDAW